MQQLSTVLKCTQFSKRGNVLKSSQMYDVYLQAHGRKCMSQHKLCAGFYMMTLWERERGESSRETMQTVLPPSSGAAAMNPADRSLHRAPARQHRMGEVRSAARPLKTPVAVSERSYRRGCPRIRRSTVMRVRDSFRKSWTEVQSDRQNAAAAITTLRRDGGIQLSHSTSVGH